MDGLLLPFALAMLLPLAGAPHGDTTLSCNSTCVGKTFKEGPREGEPVCGYELCGKTAPFVGLATFGCSAAESAWGGNCCNTSTCAGWSNDHDRETGAYFCRSEGVCEQADLQRRADAVQAICCDEASEVCVGGLPTTCNAGCAEVLLDYVEDCAGPLGRHVETLASVVALCREAELGRDPDQTPPLYELDVAYSGPSFIDGWGFMDEHDPTNGAVKYHSREEATRQKLIGYDSKKGEYLLKVDTKEVLTDRSEAGGRSSVRIASRKVWRAGGLFTIDFSHMPAGCGTWPAFWLVAAPCGVRGQCSWPIGGEIDIIEGGDLGTRLQTTLHTGGECVMDPHCRTYPNMTGSFQSSTDCDVNAFGGQNRGCGIFGKEGTYGEPLNARGKRSNDLCCCCAQVCFSACHLPHHRQSITVCVGQVGARSQRNGWSVPSRSGSSHAARSLPTSRASTLSPRHGVCRTRPSLSRPTAHRRISRTCSWSLTRPSAVGLPAEMPTRRPAMTRRCPAAMRWWGTRRQVSTTACGRRLALRCACAPNALCLQGSTAVGATTTWRSCAGGCRRASSGRASTAAASPAGAPTLRSRRCYSPAARR
eukprot:COSAG04_NODE_348_length_16121_cov_7.375172_7_plen_592_part_00